jgi:formylglycine-generating enzyme required for sulfatase activity
MNEFNSFHIKAVICIILLTISPPLLAELSSLRIEGAPEKSSDEIVGVKDVNRRECAAIQVISDMDGFSYDSYNGVVKVDDKPGHDMVYLQPDERVLEIFLTGYKPMKIILSEIGIQLKSRDVWKIEIVGEKKLIEIPITIISNPTGADVFIDDEYKGNGRSFKAEEGIHSIELRMEGYKTVQKEIGISETATLFEFKLEEIELQLVTIRSTPEKARIFINDVEVGITNKQLFYYPGEYNLVLAKSTYETIADTITIVENDENTFNYTFTKTTAILTIVSTPEDAEIYINGEKKYSKTPEVAPGKHKIEVKKEGYFPESRTVTIEKGKALTETFTLIQKTGNLQLLVEPMETNVVLQRDGREIESWVGSKMKKDIPIGEYVLIFSATGYATQQKPVSILYDKTTSQNVKMGKGSSKPISYDKSKSFSNTGMVFVEGGTFQMGTNDGLSDEKPERTVTVGSYYLGKYEVSQQEWREIMSNSPFSFMGDNLPVENVTWYNAIEFCNKKSERESLKLCYQIGAGSIVCDFTADGYRLPTEAEWEFAARGGNKSYAYQYSGSNDIKEAGWYIGNSSPQPQPVGQKKANELGLFDMSGNVWEWCQDWYNKDYYQSGAGIDPRGPSSGRIRILRGGAWNTNAKYCRRPVGFRQ